MCVCRQATRVVVGKANVTIHRGQRWRKIILHGALRIRIVSVEFPANTRIRRHRILRNLSSISAASSALLPPRSITPPPRRAFNRITARRSTSTPRRRAKEIVLQSDRFCSAVSAYYCDIVMNTFVCLSVCLSGTISPEPHARSLPNFCACCLWLGPPPAG